MEHYEIIRKAREKLALTQKEVADKLFIRHNTYSQYETGKRKIDSETLFNIIEILNIDPSSFKKGHYENLIRHSYLADIDYLTKVNNRRRFCEELVKNEHKFGIGLKIRHLTHINNTHGCDVGDTLIKIVAEEITNNFPNEFVGRIGGVEFGILSKEADKEHFIETLLSELRKIHSEIDFTTTDIHTYF